MISLFTFGVSVIAPPSPFNCGFCDNLLEITDANGTTTQGRDAAGNGLPGPPPNGVRIRWRNEARDKQVKVTQAADTIRFGSC